MSADLETRLREYGPVLDRAAERGAGAGALAERTRWPRARGRARLLAVSAAVLAVLAALTGTLLSKRWTEVAQAPAATVVETGAGVDSGTTPVRLVEGLVAWYVLSPADAASFEPLVVDVEVACSEWAMAGDDVECLSVVNRSFRPQVGYTDDGRGVTISTIHSRTRSAEEYATEYAERHPLDPVGTTTTPIVLSDGRPAIHASGNDDADQRVTFAAASGTLVSLTAHSLTRDELVGLAERVVPAADVPPLPLLLAVTGQWQYQPAGAPTWLLGGVSDDEVCAFGTNRVALGSTPPCHPLGSDQVLLIDAGTAGVYSGLVGPDVEFLRLTFDDGAEPWSRPTPQQVGEVQAFVIDHQGPQAIALAALDEHAQELRVVDVRLVSGADPATGTFPLRA